MFQLRPDVVSFDNYYFCIFTSSVNPASLPFIIFNQHTIIMLSINILPASQVKVYTKTMSETRFHISTRATEFPRAQCDML